MDLITRSLLDAFSAEYDISRLKEPDRFEHFVNYSIVSKLSRTTFELMDLHTGGGGDLAFDGVCIFVNGKLVTKKQELMEILESYKYLDIDVVFIQSKTSSNFEGGEILKFINGIKNFVSDEELVSVNEKIKDLKDVWNEIIKNSQYMCNRRPCGKFYYVTTGIWNEDANLKSIVSNGEVELSATGIFDEVKIFTYGASELQKIYRETKNKLSTTITFQNRITLPDIDKVQEAYLGFVPFYEFLKLIRDDNNALYSIFDDNIRDYQSESPVNGKIRETIASGKFELFCVLNNGITLVATSITPAGNRFTLRDYQIVNGCQTSNVLHQCQNIPGIEAISVPIKIIVTESEDVKSEITLATNSQTEVKLEQLEALSKFQRGLELYYSSETGFIKLYYERRSQQYNSNPSVKGIQTISIPIQIKSFASVFLDSPHLVSGYYGTIVNRFKDKIFKEGDKYLPYYVSSLCFYRIEQFFRSGDLDSKYKKSRFHIMMMVKKLCVGLKEYAFNSNAIEKQCEAFKRILLDDKECLKYFILATSLFDSSGIDLNKAQYKSETETEILINSVDGYLKKSKDLDNSDNESPMNLTLF